MKKFLWSSLKAMNEKVMRIKSINVTPRFSKALDNVRFWGYINSTHQSFPDNLVIPSQHTKVRINKLR